MQVARQQYDRNRSLYRSGALPKAEYDAPVEQYTLLIGRLEGMHDELAEEVELLKLEVSEEAGGGQACRSPTNRLRCDGSTKQAFTRTKTRSD